MNILFFTFYLFSQPLPPQLIPTGIKFLFEAPDAEFVNIAGSFNNWNSTDPKTKMKKNPDGIWELTLTLPPGSYEYKYVINASQWVPDGPNLQLILKLVDNKLKLISPGLMPTTVYSGKIKLTGKYIGDFEVAKSTITDSMESLNPIHHLDLDWQIRPFEGTEVFARWEVNATQSYTRLRFLAGYLDFYQPWFKVRFFSRIKSLQFEDPLKLLDTKQNLRYEKLTFFDELNPHKAFGLNFQGVYLNTQPLDIATTFFYSNSDTSLEDRFGLTIQKKLEKFKLGLNYIGQKGANWIYSQYGGWFPDPSNPNGLLPPVPHFEQSRGNTQPWYKGFVEADTIGFDFGFDFVKNATIFFETTNEEKKLQAYRWNEGRGADSPSKKNWNLYKKADTIIGTKINLGKNSLQIYNLTTSLKLTSPLFPNEKPKKSETNFLTSTKFENFEFRFLFSNTKFSQPSKDINFELFYYYPLREDIYYQISQNPYGWFYSLSNYLFQYITPDRIVSILPTEKFRLGFQLDFKTNFVDFYTIGFMDSYKEKEDITQAPKSLTTNEILSGFLITPFKTKNLKDFHLETHLRSFRFYSQRYSTSVNSLGYYLGLAFIKKPGLTLRFGTGIYPEFFDEDLDYTYDNRSNFLYNSYIMNFLEKRWKTMYDGIIFSEESLNNRRFFFRADYRF